jgi:hypothetical protein
MAAFAVVDDAGRVDAGPQRLGERVMARHAVLLAAGLSIRHREA